MLCPAAGEEESSLNAGDNDVVLTTSVQVENQIWYWSWFFLRALSLTINSVSIPCYSVFTVITDFWIIGIVLARCESIINPVMFFLLVFLILISYWLFRRISLSHSHLKWVKSVTESWEMWEWMNILYARKHCFSVSISGPETKSGFSLLKTEVFYHSPPPKSSSTFTTDQNSFPIFGRVFCRTHLIPLPILSVLLLPPSLPLLSEGHCRGPRVGLHVFHNSPLPTRGTLKSPWSFLYIAFTFKLSSFVMSFCKLKGIYFGATDLLFFFSRSAL